MKGRQTPHLERCGWNGEEQVRDVYQLLAVLAHDWSRPGSRRILMGSKHGGQFVRLPNQTGHGIIFRRERDIPVDSGDVDLEGVLAREIEGVLPGLLKTSHAEHGYWHSAELSEEGFHVVRYGEPFVNLAHADVSRKRFWNPRGLPIDHALDPGEARAAAAAAADRARAGERPPLSAWALAFGDATVHSGKTLGLS